MRNIGENEITNMGGGFNYINCDCISEIGKEMEVTLTLDSTTGKYYLDGASTQATRNGKNKFNSKAVANGNIYSTEADGTIVLQNNPHSIGYFGLTTLKSLCPELKVGDTAYLYIQTNNDYKYIYLHGVPERWNNNTSKVITQEMLDGGVAIYGGEKGTADRIKIQVTLDAYDDNYEAYGISPSPDYPSEIVNTYKAGRYKTTINGTEYRFNLADDLRSTGSIKDRFTLDTTNKTGNVNRVIERRILNGKENWTFNSQYGSYSLSLAQVIGQNSAGLCTHFKNIASSQLGTDVGIFTTYTSNLYISYPSISSIELFKEWLNNNNTEVIYQMAVPIDESVEVS